MTLETRDRLGHIFEKQLELMKQFHAIEVQNLGFEFDPIVDLETCKGQARIRELASRVAIEVAETCNARTSGEILEEVADVLHFLVELFICCGLAANEIAPLRQIPPDGLEGAYTAAIGWVPEWSHPMSMRAEWAEFSIGLWNWLHALKSKPWTLKPKPTDVPQFKEDACIVFLQFLAACHMNDITTQALYDAYFAKHKINLDRIAASNA